MNNKIDKERVNFKLIRIQHSIVSDGSVQAGQHRLFATVQLYNGGIALQRKVIISQLDIFNYAIREAKHLIKKGTIFQQEYTEVISGKIDKDITLHEVEHKFMNNHDNLRGHVLFIKLRINDHEEEVLKERTIIMNQTDMYTLISKKLKDLKERNELYNPLYTVQMNKKWDKV